MWRKWILARNGFAFHSYNTIALRIQVPLSNSNSLINHTPHSSSSFGVFPQSSYLFNNNNTPRFFSHQITDSTLTIENGVSMDSLENDGGVQKDDGGDEQCVGEVVVEEVEDEVYQIDEEKLENVVSLLQNSSDGSLESSLDDMDLTLHQDCHQSV
ncbi:hypothetical protein SESBI_40528 [Sesbania bispinosa]|nr:hypothetical protein SESBI_40528 [Sesbania bispinosa]